MGRVVRAVLTHPDTGELLRGKAVQVQLVPDGSLDTGTHTRVLQSSFPRTSKGDGTTYVNKLAAGTLQVTLRANSGADPDTITTPAGTHYEFTLPGSIVVSVVVPSGTPPHTDDTTDPDNPVDYWWLDEVTVSSPPTPDVVFHGVPAGGTTGQVFTKRSDTDWDVDWEDAGGGTGAVASVFGRTGVVTADSGDYAAFYDALGAAAAAQAAAIAASQPLDSDLTAIAALTTTAFGRSVLTQADAAALRTLAGLGTAATHATGDFDTAGAAAAAQAASQPLDSDLTAIAALTTTAFGRGLLALADAAALRTAAGLGTAATSNTGDFDAAGAAAAAQAASQPLDSDLTAIAALSTTSFGRSFLALADAAAGRSLLGLGTAAQSASTDFQPIDSDLTAIAALATTTFGRSLLTQADAAATRTTLGLGTLATQSGTFSGTSSGTNTGDQTITLTGDVTGSGTGSFAATLATSGVTAASYGDATHVVQVTFDAKGRATSASSVAIAIPESAVTNLTTDLAAKAPLASPALTGSPTAPTQTQSDNSTKIATTAYVDTAANPTAGKLFLAANYR